MNIVLGALCLLAVGTWLSYAYRHSRVWLWRVLGLMALVVAVWFAVILYRGHVYMAGLEYERRQDRAAKLGMDLIGTTNSTMLDGTSREFTEDLASILGLPQA